MPYRRYRRRRVYRKRTVNRSYRRRFRRTTRYNRKGQKLYLFKRKVDLNPIVLSSASQTLIGLNFSLNDLPNYTEFTNLYDSYKINGVRVRFFPAMTEATTVSTSNAPAAETRIITVIDRNDSTAPGSFDDLRQYQSAKVVRINKPFKRYISKPCILDTSGYSISPWMSTAFPSTSYFGLKFASEATQQSSGTYQYNLEATYYLSFKTVK